MDTNGRKLKNNVGGGRAGADLRAVPVTPSLAEVALQAAPTGGVYVMVG